MNKKKLTFFLGILLACSIAACGEPNKQGSTGDDAQVEDSAEKDNKEGGDQQSDSQEPLLDSDATDEELLDLVKDDLNVVSEGKYDEIVTDMKENPGNYSGQLYQLEGFYTEKDGTSYITNSLEEGDQGGNSLPLQYMTEKPQEGARIRVTGVLEEVEEAATFGVVVVESLD